MSDLKIIRIKDIMTMCVVCESTAQKMYKEMKNIYKTKRLTHKHLKNYLYT